MNQFVIGFEGDFNGASINGSSTFKVGNPLNTYLRQDDLEWLGSIRGRLGFVAGSTLIYGTAGWAWGHTSTFINLTNAPAAGAIQDYEKTRGGWTVGAGAEMRLVANLLGRLEYRFTRLDDGAVTQGTNVFGGPPPAFTFTDRMQVDVHTVMIGLAAKF